MRSYKKLYPKICSFENLHLAFVKARRKKRHKKGVAEFEYNLERNLLKIKRELEGLNYDPSQPKKFILKEPKKRVIFVVDFKDRVVHHALCNVIEPLFERSFIFDSYACRRAKGTHRAVARLDEFKRKVSRNNSRQVYVLKADVRKYFDTIDHQILLKIISRKIKDKKTMRLIKKIVESYEGKGDLKGKGVPIGNLTSQLFANIYLNELDHFVKAPLDRFASNGVKYYIRYMDDMVILSPSIDFLSQTKEAISEFLRERLNLKLHPRKSRIFPLARGVDFLGYRSFYYYKLLRQGSVKRIRDRLRVLGKEYRECQKDLSEIRSSVMAWQGYSKHADTYRLRKDLLKDLKFLVEV